MRRAWVVLLAMIATGAWAQTQEAEKKGTPKNPQVEEPLAALDPSDPKWSVDDLIQIEDIGEARLSPDGRWTAWVKRTANKEKNERVSNLFLSSMQGGEPVQLTRGAFSVERPRWAPGGALLAFISDRPAPKGEGEEEGKKSEEEPAVQLWVIHPQGGEAWPLTNFEGGVQSFDWAGNGTIIVSAQELPSLYSARAKEEKDTARVVDDEEHAPPVRLYEVDVKAKKIARLTDNGDRIQTVAVSPDGRWAATIHERSLRFVYDNLHKPLVFLYDLKNGTRKQLFEGRVVQDVYWSRDGKGFYAVAALATHPQYVMAAIPEVHYYDLAAGAATKVDLGWERSLAGTRGDFVPTADGFLAVLANGARNKPARYVREGNAWKQQWISGEHAENIFGMDAAGDAVVYLYSTASRPPQLVRARLNGAKLDDPVPFTKVNEHLAKKNVSRAEIIRWKGSLDEEVEGILYYPHNYQAGKKYPLMVTPHGGPAGADFDNFDDSWAYPINLFTQRGAFVFRPNYHGSSNYGLKWVESIGGGKYYDLEVPDLEKGVEYLIQRGLADPDKIGAQGWSNGAILTTALTIANPPRYKVASSGAGDVEWSSDWANAHFGAAFDNYYFGKSPLEDPKLYMEKSPFYKLDRVRTPTIIFFGTEDTNVPTQQGWMHYRGLQQLGKTDTRFLLFPGEKHGFRKLTHQKRKVEEELAWLDKYLFKTQAAHNEALKEGSRLEVALKLRKAKRDAAAYGVAGKQKGSLAPETVSHGGVEVGRFEVTRAQFKRFDPKYEVAAGRENYPANNISFERAKAYTEWLTKQAGELYRLPTEGEAAVLYGSVGKQENTLDEWAGYAVNPDDAAKLAPMVKELGPESLLKEVGGFKSAGEDDPLFDLGGNVAEWVVTKDGTGKVMGGSADTPVDARIRQRKPAPEFVGFRVVKGPVKTAAAK